MSNESKSKNLIQSLDTVASQNSTPFTSQNKKMRMLLSPPSKVPVIPPQNSNMNRTPRMTQDTSQSKNIQRPPWRTPIKVDYKIINNISTQSTKSRSRKNSNVGQRDLTQDKLKFNRYISILKNIEEIIKYWHNLDHAISQNKVMLSNARKMYKESKRPNDDDLKLEVNYYTIIMNRLEIIKGQYQEIDKFLNRIHNDQTSPLVWRFAAFYQRAVINFRLGKLDQSHQFLRKAIETKYQKFDCFCFKKFIQILDMQMNFKYANERLRKYCNVYGGCEWGRWAEFQYERAFQSGGELPTRPLLVPKKSREIIQNEKQKLRCKIDFTEVKDYQIDISDIDDLEKGRRLFQ